MDHSEDVLSALRDFSDSDLPNYTICIRQAFATVHPVFIREKYAEFFFHCASTVPHWIARVVLANADAESHGSEKLFCLWRGSLANAEISKDVLVHAKDESRHSRLFVSLIEKAFPRSFDTKELDSKRRQLFRIIPQALHDERFAIPDDVLMDHLVQMNMGEIRTRVHMLLLSPVIYAFTPNESKEAVRRVLEGLITDEIRHINYTAQFIESWCTTGDRRRVFDLYSRRLKDFHELTIQQTEASIRAYGAGKFPELLEI